MESIATDPENLTRLYALHGNSAGVGRALGVDGARVRKWRERGQVPAAMRPAVARAAWPSAEPTPAQDAPSYQGRPLDPAEVEARHATSARVLAAMDHAIAKRAAEVEAAPAPAHALLRGLDHAARTMRQGGFGLFGVDVRAVLIDTDGLIAHADAALDPATGDLVAGAGLSVLRFWSGPAEGNHHWLHEITLSGVEIPGPGTPHKYALARGDAALGAVAGTPCAWVERVSGRHLGEALLSAARSSKGLRIATIGEVLAFLRAPQKVARVGA